MITTIATRTTRVVPVFAAAFDMNSILLCYL
jgi:hypothetical protein